MAENKQSYKDEVNNNKYVVWVMLGLAIVTAIGTALIKWQEIYTWFKKKPTEPMEITTTQVENLEEIEIISGTVLDVKTRKGIPYVKIKPRNKPGNQSAQTDSEGVFTIALPGRGKEMIKFIFEHKDYETREENINVIFNDAEKEFPLPGEIFLKKKINLIPTL